MHLCLKFNRKRVIDVYDCIPLINKKNIIKEYSDNNYHTIIPRLLFNHEEIVLNETAKFIYKLINNEASMKKIIDSFCKNYTNITNEVAEMDVNEIIFMLWRFGIVEWKDINPYRYQYFKQFDGYSVEILLLETVSEFLIQSKKCEYEYCNPYRFRKDIIQKEFLEQAIVNRFSYSFIVRKEKEVALLGIISFDYQDFALTLDYLGLVSFEFVRNVDKQKQDMILRWIEERVIIENKTILPNKSSSINWIVLSNDKDEKFENYMNNLKPKNKFLLSNETIDGDVMMYLFKR